MVLAVVEADGVRADHRRECGVRPGQWRQDHRRRGPGRAGQAAQGEHRCPGGGGEEQFPAVEGVPGRNGCVVHNVLRAVGVQGGTAPRRRSGRRGAAGAATDAAVGTWNCRRNVPGCQQGTVFRPDRRRGGRGGGVPAEPATQGAGDESPAPCGVLLIVFGLQRQFDPVPCLNTPFPGLLKHVRGSFAAAQPSLHGLEGGENQPRAWRSGPHPEQTKLPKSAGWTKSWVDRD